MGKSALIIVGLALVALAPRAGRAAKRTLPPAPVHPDTLPSLIQAWSLPATLTPTVANAYTPRMALQGKLLYVYDHHGRRLAAVKHKSGKVAWHVPVPARSDRAFSFTPYVHKGQVFVANDGFLYAFGSKTGKPSWRLPIKGIAANGMGRSKHRIYLPLVRAKGRRVQPGVHVWGVDSRNGRFLWSKKYPGGFGYVRGNPDGAYYISNTGVVLALTPDRGEPRWQLRVDGRVTAPPILKGKNLFITAMREKAGWRGAGVYCVDISTGKLRWKTKISSQRYSQFLYGAQLGIVEDSGKLTLFDNLDGKRSTELKLSFSGRPHSLHGAASGKRGFVFYSDAEGHGFLTLVDLVKKRVLATANALPMHVRSMLPSGRTVYLDGKSGDVYAYRLDRSQRPKRRSVPPAEFAQQLLDRANARKGASEDLELRLAGLGMKAVGPIERALAGDNPYVVSAAARAIGILRARRAVGGVLSALRKQATTPKKWRTPDPVIALIDSLASIRDGRAVKQLAKMVRSQGQSHQRRRAAYVALGAIGTPAALNPIWSFRAKKEISSAPFEPQASTMIFDQRVSRDHPTEWKDKVRRRTTRTVQTKDGQIYTVALSPFLGGYNDVWVGKSDLSGQIEAPLFTGLTKAEIGRKRFIKLKRLTVGKGNVTLRIEMKRGKKWIASRPVTLSLAKLAADRDGDRLPDLVERRLRLCLTHPDCDGDGIRDSEDLNPLASGKLKLTRDQRLFRESFFAFYAFLKRRGIVVVDPGKGPSFELYGRRDPIISLRRPAIKAMQKEAGLHGVDFVSFGGPYPEGGGSGDAKPAVEITGKGKLAKLGMDIVRAGNNAVAYNVSLRRVGKNWVVTRMYRVWAAQ